MISARRFPCLRTFNYPEENHMIFVVTKCADCPFMAVVNGERTCNIATPRQRPITEDEDRPFWCKMRKEQIIVRDFK